MSTNIIQFPGSNTTFSSAPATKTEPVEAVAHGDGNRRRSTELRPATPSDGRRREGGKSRSVERNIQEIPGENGGLSYRVQIRKSVDGKTFSFTKTFSKLAMARKWKKRKLAEIEIDGVQTLSRSGDTVADAISGRLATHASLGRSAKQQLEWLRASDFGKMKLTELRVRDLTNLADEMLGEERQPQTVAGYLSILVSTLDWASRREYPVPIAALKQAMQLMWEDEVLARSEERARRPTLDELNKILEAVAANKRQKMALLQKACVGFTS